MGTTSMRYTKCTHSEFGKKELKEFIEDEYRDVEFAMIHFVPNNSEHHIMYSIMRNRNNGTAFICVTKIQIYQGEIYWKDITENMGPVYDDCAVDLFKWVTPPNDYAIEWRKRCTENNKPLNRVF
jgi:hypothetical protein